MSEKDNLRVRLLDFVKKMPNINNPRSREALIGSVNFDEKLLNQLDYSGATSEFATHLINTFIAFGTLSDGRDSIEALLDACKSFVGIDLVDECNDIIDGWRKIVKDERKKGVGRQQILKSRQKYLTVLRDKVAYIPLSFVNNAVSSKNIPIEHIYIPLPTNLTMSLKVKNLKISEWWVGSDYSGEEIDSPIHFRNSSMTNYDKEVSENIVSEIQKRIDAVDGIITDEEKEIPLIYAPLWENRKFKDYFRFDIMQVTSIASRLIILGEPGTGKSTFAKYLALCLLNSQLPPPLQGPNISQFDTWTHGELTPVFVELRRLFNWPKFPAIGESITPNVLWDFICDEYLQENEGFKSVLLDEMEEGKALIIFDGIDEIPLGIDDHELRRQQIIDLVRNVDFAFRTTRVIFTSRPYGYKGLENEFQREGYVEINLIPLRQKQILNLAEKFYMASGKKEDSKNYAKLLMSELEGVDDFLKDRPLFLTLMANLLLTNNEKGLPKRAGLLFKESIALLLYRWVKVRTGEKNTKFINDETEKLLQVLESIAYNAHVTSTADHAEDATNIRVGAIVEELMEGFSTTQVFDVLSYLTQQAGILKQVDEKTYRFHHRTFEEFLAASHLARQNDYKKIREHIQSNPNLWREAFVFLGDVLDEGKMWELLRVLAFYNISTKLSSHWYSIWLAGRIVSNRKCYRSVGEDNQFIIDQIGERIKIMITQAVEMSKKDIVSSAKILGLFGDNRYGVGLNPESNLPEISWCKLPSGKFIAGTNDEMLSKIKEKSWSGGWTNFDRELPSFEWIIDGFEISRYPITVGQFRAFIKAFDGYYNKEWWLPLGIELHTIHGFEPYDNNDDPINLPKNNVSWFEAMAFCKWLSFKQNEIIRLPTEVEWEWAARGVTNNIFPWGDEYDPSLANVSDTQLDGPSPVGCFVSENGVWGDNTPIEMIGNVWEWCSTICEKEGEFSYKYPYDPIDGREFIEAGDEYLRIVRGGSYTNVPILARNTFRGRDRPFYRRPRQGFRIVKEIQK